jgi:hypothetical protein
MPAARACCENSWQDKANRVSTRLAQLQFQFSVSRESRFRFEEFAGMGFKEGRERSAIPLTERENR